VVDPTETRIEPQNMFLEDKGIRMSSLMIGKKSFKKKVKRLQARRKWARVIKGRKKQSRLAGRRPIRTQKPSQVAPKGL